MVAALLAGAYVLLIGLTVVISLAKLSGYTMTLSGWNLAAYRRINLIDLKAIAMSLLIALPVAALSVIATLSTVTLLFWRGHARLAAGMLLPGFLCCPALRSIALPTLLGSIAGQANTSTTAAINLVLALLCFGATALPFCLAIALLGASGRLARYFEIYRNLGGPLWGAFRSVALPVMRPSAIASFLVAVPVITFDPYSMRVAGAQVLPSAGALLSDLRSASDWPMIAVVCLLSLLFIAPIFALLLPATTRSVSLG